MSDVQGDPPTDEQQVAYLQSLENGGQSLPEDLAVDESIPQPDQDPNIVIKSDEGAEG